MIGGRINQAHSGYGYQTGVEYGFRQLVECDCSLPIVHASHCSLSAVDRSDSIFSSVMMQERSKRVAVAPTRYGMSVTKAISVACLFSKRAFLAVSNECVNGLRLDAMCSEPIRP